MGAYTETSVRIDKLTKEQTERIVKHALWRLSGIEFYSNYKEKGFDFSLDKWLEMHEKNKKYFMECGVSEDKLSKKYLTKNLKERIKRLENKEKDLNAVLSGTMSFEKCITKNNMLKRYSDISVLKYNGHYYVELMHEIFRNPEYDQLRLNLHTVDDLINHLKQRNGVLDYDKVDDGYIPLTKELEKKIRDYYTQIGDNNFVVNFG